MRCLYVDIYLAFFRFLCLVQTHFELETFASRFVAGAVFNKSNDDCSFPFPFSVVRIRKPSTQEVWLTEFLSTEH